MIRSVLAQCTVSDLDRAEQWYTRLFNSPPDARPMPGLLEWHLGDTFGVQVWAKPTVLGGRPSCSARLISTKPPRA
jgi:hypothetical protein